MPKRTVSLPWYQPGLSFTCTQCGNCCTGGPGYVWISDEEIALLAQHLKLTVEETLKHHCRKLHGRISLKERRTPAGKYDCVFLVDYTTPEGVTKKGCAIYPVRPLQCRTWPFWDGNLDTPGDWQRAKKTCPGLDKGKAYTFEQIEHLRTTETWPETSETPSSK